MQIVDAVLKGTPASQVAKANDLHPESVRCWVRDFKKYQKDAFAGTLKREEIWSRSYVDLEHAQRSISEYIQDYNLHRSHSSLAKRSPIEFERMYHQAALGQPCQAELSVP